MNNLKWFGFDSLIHERHSMKEENNKIYYIESEEVFGYISI